MKLLYFIVLISAIAVAAAREEGEFHFVSSATSSIVYRDAGFSCSPHDCHLTLALLNSLNRLFPSPSSLLGQK